MFGFWWSFVVGIQEVLLNNGFQGWIDHPVQKIGLVGKRLVVVVCLLVALR